MRRALVATLLLAIGSGPLAAQQGWEWVEVAPAPASPPVRDGAAMVYDETRGSCLLFGGRGLGSSLRDTWAWDGVSWQSLAVEGPQARFGHGLVRDVRRQRTTLFGGFGGFALGDAWEFDGSTWLERIVVGTAPSPRTLHAMAADSVRGLTVLFGGVNGPALGDTWTWDGQLWRRVALGGSSPGARSGHGMVADAARGRIVLFGGIDAAGAHRNDVWEWDGTLWHAVPATGPAPSPRAGHSMAHDQVRGRTVVHGGSTGAGFLSDTWEWDGTSWRALGVSGPSVLPSYRHAMAFDSVRSRMVLVGGSNLLSFVAGTWELVPVQQGSVDTVTATPLVQAQLPSALSGHALAPLPSGSGHLLFGGQQAGGLLGTTHVLQSYSWSIRVSLLNPTARTDAAMVMDPVRQENVLFGGRDALGQPLADTWFHRAGQWQVHTGQVVPTARSGHRMAFDDARGKVLLHGGRDAQQAFLADTWTWDGTRWLPSATTGGPSARSEHGLVHDSTRARTVLYGGDSATGRCGDLWEWDGQAWTRREPTTGPNGWRPRPRSGHAMAWDPPSGRAVVVGGTTEYGCSDEIWSWNGGAWTLHTAGGRAVPSPRAGAQLAFAPGLGGLLLAGGTCASARLQDAWVLECGVRAQVTSYGAGCAGSVGVPRLAAQAASQPLLGQRLVLEVGNLPDTPQTLVAGLFDTQRASAGGAPLPLDLGPVGLSGCALWTGAQSVELLARDPVHDCAVWPVDIPARPVLLGVSLFFQALVLEEAHGRVASFSAGLEARIGNRGT